MTEGYVLNVVFETILKVGQPTHIFVVKTSSAGDNINSPSHFATTMGFLQREQLLHESACAVVTSHLRLQLETFAAQQKKCASLHPIATTQHRWY